MFVDNSPVFRLTGSDGDDRGHDSSARRCAAGGRAARSSSRSGVAVVDAPVGRGRVLVFGPQIAFRAQSHATFKFLFNAIFYSKAEPRLRLEATARQAQDSTCGR